MVYSVDFYFFIGYNMRAKSIISSGDIFGEWTVVREIEPIIYGKTKKIKRRMFLCRCSCGGEFNVRINGLMNGGSKKCRNCHNKEAARSPKNPNKIIGNGHPGWKGGIRKTSNGYIEQCQYDHPRASLNGSYVFQHILVMEKHIGRYLTKDEHVHHKNGIKTDNRIENLELWTGFHPSGSRVSDLIEYAKSILKLYKPELLKEI